MNIDYKDRLEYLGSKEEICKVVQEAYEKGREVRSDENEYDNWLKTTTFKLEMVLGPEIAKAFENEVMYRMFNFEGNWRSNRFSRRDLDIKLEFLRSLSDHIEMLPEGYIETIKKRGRYDPYQEEKDEKKTIIIYSNYGNINAGTVNGDMNQNIRVVYDERLRDLERKMISNNVDSDVIKYTITELRKIDPADKKSAKSIFTKVWEKVVRYIPNAMATIEALMNIGKMFK